MALVLLLIALGAAGFLWLRGSPPAADPADPVPGPRPSTVIERSRQSVERLEQIQRQREERFRRLP